MFQMLKTDASCKEELQMWPAGGEEDRERTAGFSPLRQRKKTVRRSFLNATVINGFHVALVPDNTTPKGCELLFYATRMLHTTILSVGEAAVFSGPTDGSCLLAPAADVEPLPGSWRAPVRSPWYRLRGLSESSSFQLCPKGVRV